MFASSLFDLLSTLPVFRGRTLQLPVAPRRAEVACFGPHCQCCDEARILEGGHQIPRDRRVQVRHGRSHIKVPIWVAGGKVELNQDPHLTRTQIRRIGQRLPGGHDSFDMFRWKILTPSRPCPHRACFVTQFQGQVAAIEGLCPCLWASRCKVPERFYAAHADIDAAAESFGQLLAKMEEEIVGMLGSVGMNPGMLLLLDSCNVCWDWSELLLCKPSAKHIWAFIDAARLF